MTPDEALDIRLRHHLAGAPNPVAAQARAEAELRDLGALAPDAREAVDRAYRRIAPNGHRPDPLRLTIARWRNKRVKTRDVRGEPGERWSKVLAHKGSYDQFQYGSDTPSDWSGHLQRAVVCSPKSGLIVVDVDDERVYAATRTAQYLRRTDAWCTRGAGFHIPLDCRAVPPDQWPKQGPIPGADIKSNGFVPLPGSIHSTEEKYEPVFRPDGLVAVITATPQIIAAIHADRAGHRSAASANGSGGTGGGHDGEIAARVLGWVRQAVNAGQDPRDPAVRERVYARWLTIAIPHDPAWPFTREDDFEGHYDSAVAKVEATPDPPLPEGAMEWAQSTTAYGQPLNGRALPPGEHAELAQLRQEVEYLRRRVGGQPAWRPGMPLPPDSEFLRASLDTDYRSAVYARAREQQVTEDARREREAASWRRPTILEFPRSLADSLNRERPAQRYLFDGLWGAAHNLSIEAMFKTGKTTLLGSAAGSLADGTPFLGFVQVHKPDGTVAVWNTEMDSDDFDDYLAPHVSDRTRIIPAHLRSRPVPLLSSKKDRDMTVAWLRFHSAQVWIIDSWTRLCAWNNIDPVDNGQVGQLTACLDEIKGEAGVTALAVTAHMPHQARTDRAFERGFGAQGFSGWVDAMWRYVRDEACNRFLSAEGRKVHLDECQVFMGGDGRLAAVAGDRDDAAGQTLEYAVLSAVQMHPGRSTAQVVKATGRRKADAEAVLRGLEQRGLVITRPGDRGAVLWHPAA